MFSEMAMSTAVTRVPSLFQRLSARPNSRCRSPVCASTALFAASILATRSSGGPLTGSRRAWGRAPARRAAAAVAVPGLGGARGARAAAAPASASPAPRPSSSESGSAPSSSLRTTSSISPPIFSPVRSAIRRIIRPIALGSFSSTPENSRSISPIAASIRASSAGSAGPGGAEPPAPSPPFLWPAPTTAKGERILCIRNLGLSGQRGHRPALRERPRVELVDPVVVRAVEFVDRHGRARASGRAPKMPRPSRISQTSTPPRATAPRRRRDCHFARLAEHSRDANSPRHGAHPGRMRDGGRPGPAAGPGPGRRRTGCSSMSGSSRRTSSRGAPRARPARSSRSPT